MGEKKQKREGRERSKMAIGLSAFELVKQRSLTKSSALPLSPPIFDFGNVVCNFLVKMLSKLARSDIIATT